MLMDVQDYDEKIQVLLQDTAYCPITYPEKTAKAKIKASSIDKEEQQKLIPRVISSKYPKLQGESSTLSSIGSPT